MAVGGRGTRKGKPVIRAKADCWTECYHQARAMLNTSARLLSLTCVDLCRL